MSDSYLLLASAGFAQHGVLLEDVGLDHLTIDMAGFQVALDGVDLELSEQTSFDAMADTFLLFIDDEVFSVWGWDLIDVATYRLRCIRARFATQKQAHVAGADVWLVNRSLLSVLDHAQFQVGNTAELKLSPRTPIGAADLSTIDPITAVIAGRIFTQTPPINLRVNGDGRAPSWSAGQGTTIEWSLTERGRPLPAWATATTVLDFELSPPYGRLEAGPGASSVVLSADELSAALAGAHGSFLLRARTKIALPDYDLFSAAATLNVTYE